MDKVTEYFWHEENKERWPTKEQDEREAFESWHNSVFGIPKEKK